MAAHSNDGDGDTAGSVIRVPSADWPGNATRPVSGGHIPQAGHTHAYFTKAALTQVGGYASLNELQVGLAESTCVSVFPAKSGLVNIVDLSEIGLERAASARQAVTAMGNVAHLYGYRDAGESLLVVDPQEAPTIAVCTVVVCALAAYIFHILPDDTGSSAVWAAQRVPDDHAGAVANSFTIREINFNDTHQFLTSPDIRWFLHLIQDSPHQPWSSYALPELPSASHLPPFSQAGGLPFDFTKVFSGPEPGHKYASGRRMWTAFRHLIPSLPLPSTYSDYVRDVPYQATYPVSPGAKVNLTDMFGTMRDYYQGTPYDMTKGLAAGPFGTPDRWAPGPGEQQVNGHWERTIAISRSIVSYVIQARGWLAPELGGTLWLAPHAAHTSVYVPLAHCMESIPAAYSNNSLSVVDRAQGAWQASRFVFNIAQIHFGLMIQDIQEEQTRLEQASMQLQAQADAKGDPSWTASAYTANAVLVASEWWASLRAPLHCLPHPSSETQVESVGPVDDSVGYPDGPPPATPSLPALGHGSTSTAGRQSSVGILLLQHDGDGDGLLSANELGNLLKSIGSPQLVKPPHAS
eukprot:gene10841-41_t